MMSPGETLTIPQVYEGGVIRDAVVVAGNSAFFSYVKEIGLIDGSAQWLTRANEQAIAGRHVIAAFLPLHLLSQAESYTALTFNLPSGVNVHHATLSELRAGARAPQTYVLRRVETA